MRLHFYTGIAMSIIAAEYANAACLDGDQSLDTVSTAESWASPYHFSQTESMAEKSTKAAVKAKKSAKKVAKAKTKAKAPTKTKGKNYFHPPQIDFI